MKKLLIRMTAALVLLFTFVTASQGQSLPTAPTGSAKAEAAVDEVENLLDRYVLALGGLKLFSLKSRVMRGRVEMSGVALAGTFEQYEKEHGKSITVVNAPGGQFLTGTNDGKRWMQTPWGATMSVASAGGTDLLEQARAGKGFRWSNAFSTAAIKGRATVEGRETVVLAATPRGGEPLLIYFDAETNLPRKTERVRAGGDDDLVRAVYFDSYATVDGVKVPALFRQVTAKYTLTFRVTEVKHNVPINDVLFESPTAK
ncbi:MAG TPA: hypothetical protein VF521_18835 [Pyrinomonadaceae bacterium]